ncbi:beta-glucuronidase [Lactobacillus porci]|uniref:beta-glucuronidase n=1 Tax=Lactobacillus porci TaxID=2012477 RepID=UPI0039914C3F
MLYPKNTVTRTLISLDGMWKFQPEDGTIDPGKPLPAPQWMAVPGSFNSQTPDAKFNNRTGYFWYETTLVIPADQAQKRNVLHFGSVTHSCEVFLNGKKIGSHVGGFTPFEIDISVFAKAGDNDLKVRVSNILDNTTLPSADYHDGTVQPRFDFFNFAGIHRPVRLYSTNQTYLETIQVPYETDLVQTTVMPKITVHGDFASCQVSILDENNEVIDTTDSLTGELHISDTHLWQVGKAYLYQLRVSLFDENANLLDTYTHQFGVRTVAVKHNKFLVNGKPVYFQGFGRHEDFIASGKGLNLPLLNLDYQIMKDLGANSYRTSHYPYSEEAMQQADREGFLIIDEVPAVGFFLGFNVDLADKRVAKSTWDVLDPQANHEQALREMINRDVDHPCVVMWSIANEPAGHQAGAHEYFEPLCKLAKSLDWQKRPITWADIGNDDWDVDKIADLFDVICLNRYFGWYSEHGDLAAAKQALSENIEHWHGRFPDKPLLFTEFGADTVAGLHNLEREPYSEEYQTDLIAAYFDVFDKYPYIIGEQLWNFADFKTSDSLIRVNGNLKGVFTRDRQPKQVAGLLKDRWTHGVEDRAAK